MWWKGVYMRILVLVVLALGIASQAAAAELSTWSGSIGLVRERGLSHPSVKLAVGASSARADFNGFTGAAHDPPTAKTTCWISYRFLAKRGSWRYYREIGRPHLTAAGYVEDSPCLGANGQTLRVRMLSSRELSAQFDTDPFSAPDEFIAAYAGRLHR
jgi:hypothetical protein